MIDLPFPVTVIVRAFIFYSDGLEVAKQNKRTSKRTRTRRLAAASVPSVCPKGMFVLYLLLFYFTPSSMLLEMMVSVRRNGIKGASRSLPDSKMSSLASCLCSRKSTTPKKEQSEMQQVTNQSPNTV